MVLPPNVILQRWHIDVQNWEDEVVAAELLFAPQKRFKFQSAIWAGDHRRRDDRDEEDRLPNGIFDLTFPERA